MVETIKTSLAFAASLLLCLFSFADSFSGFETPKGRLCVPAARIASSVKGLPDFSISASSAINPVWNGDCAIVFNCVKPSLRLPLDPWAPGRHELKIGYVSGGSYSGFSVKANGVALGKAASSSGQAFPAIAAFETGPLWACGNVLELVPEGEGALGLCFVDLAPIEFEGVEASALKSLSDTELRAFLLNVVPYSSPHLRFGSDSACKLKVNGKDFADCPAGGSVSKQLENPGAKPALLEFSFEAKPGFFKLESSPLGGGRVVPELPAFLDSSYSFEAAPKAEISNGIVTALFGLPDPLKGCYRGIRFEQAGMALSIKAFGHEFAGGASPERRDAFYDVSGPAEEFSEAVGFQDPDSSCFLKLGVGVFEKPFTKDFAFGWLYIPKELFKWDVAAGPSSIEFRQSVSFQGWAYEYVKRVSLPEGKARLLVERSLKNTGSKRLASSHYSHNYFLVDRLPPGPDYSLDCHFRPFFLNPELNGGFVQSGSLVGFKGPGVLFSHMLGGFGAKGSNFVLSHKPSGASVSISELSPAYRQALFVNAEGICPESFARIDLGPGESASWTRAYDFETKR